VARLAAVEAGFLRESDAIVQTEGVEDGRAHTAGGGSAGDDDAVAAQQGEIARHVGAEEAGRLLLEDHDVARAGGDGSHDVVAVDVGAGPDGLVLTRAAFFQR
jgi:hypothetical protein